MEPFTAIAAFLAKAAAVTGEAAATAGAAVAEGASAVGAAITEGAGALAEGAGEAVTAMGEAGQAIGETAASAAPQAGSSNIMSVVKDFGTGFMDKNADLIVNNADGTMNWGKSLSRMAGRGTSKIGGAIAEKALNNNQEHQSNARRMINNSIVGLF
jgi:hypothetical protein